MIEQAVGGEVLVDRAERVRGRRHAAGAGHAARRVDDDPGALDQAGIEQRGQRQRGGRDVAAGRRDQRRAGQLLAGALGQAVDRAWPAGRADRARSRTTSGTATRPSAGTPPTGRRCTRPSRRAAGTSAIDASCGSPRNATSRPSVGDPVDVERARTCSPGYDAASDGYRSAAAPPALLSAVATTSSMSGCPASNRSSSAPVYPDAPMMPARTMNA